MAQLLSVSQDGLIVSKRMDIVVGLDAQQGKGDTASLHISH